MILVHLLLPCRGPHGAPQKTTELYIFPELQTVVKKITSVGIGRSICHFHFSSEVFSSGKNNHRDIKECGCPKKTVLCAKKPPAVLGFLYQADTKHELCQSCRAIRFHSLPGPPSFHGIVSGYLPRDPSIFSEGTWTLKAPT